MKDEIYLGDAVYAGQDGYHIWLWTSDGIEKSKPVALEPAVLDALFAYRSRLLERVRIARTMAREDSEDADAEASR
jgi:hypothetical protein